MFAGVLLISLREGKEHEQDHVHEQEGSATGASVELPGAYGSVVTMRWQPPERRRQWRQKVKQQSAP